MKIFKRLSLAAFSVVMVISGFGAGTLDVQAKGNDQDRIRQKFRQWCLEAQKENADVLQSNAYGVETKYSLCIGDVQVTSQNQNDIPGVLGGKASYNPITNTLTLTNVTGVEEPFRFGTDPDATSMAIISFMEDLKIVGNATFKDVDVGILQNQDLVLEADLTIDADLCGIMAYNIDINKGNLDVTSINRKNKKDIVGVAIYADQQLNVNGGSIKAHGAYNGLASDEKPICLSGGSVEAEGSKGGIYSNGSAVLMADFMEISYPVGGKLNPQMGTITDSKGNVATKVKITRRKISGLVGITSVSDPEPTLLVDVEQCNVKNLKYQWKRDGKAIAGATYLSYKPVLADVGKSITVEVKDADDLYEGSIESKASVVITKDDVGNVNAEISTKVEERFADVTAGEWYVPAVQFVFGKSIMNGTSMVTFEPMTVLTRAQFVTVLHNMENKPKADYKNVFTDVPKGAWFTTPVMWAYKNEITSGISKTEFGADTKITREQLATMLYKYAKVKKYKTTFDKKALDAFPDKDKISSWATEAMQWAVSNGIMSGKGQADGSKLLDPAGQATRAECAQMIKNLCDNLVK